MKNKTLPISIYHRVRFKVTPFGQEVWDNHWKEVIPKTLNIETFEKLCTLKKDKENNSVLTLMEFMNVFGKHMTVGNEYVIEDGKLNVFINDKFL